MRVHCAQGGSPVWRVQLSASVAEGEGTERVALDESGLEALDHTLGLAAAGTCRVLVIESCAPMFCAGMDLEAVRTTDAEAQRRGLDLYARCLSQLVQGSFATVALVDGPALGGGVGLAAAADCVLASRAAVFRLPELGLGLIPAMVLPVLRRRLTVAQTRWMALSGRKVDAEDAQRLGLVDTVVDDGDALEAELRRVLKGLLRQSPRAVQTLAEFERSIAGLDLDPALAKGAERTAADLCDPETTAAIDALAEGELPTWFSRYKPRES